MRTVAARRRAARDAEEAVVAYIDVGRRNVFPFEDVNSSTGKHFPVKVSSRLHFPIVGWLTPRSEARKRSLRGLRRGAYHGRPFGVVQPRRVADRHREC